MRLEKRNHFTNIIWLLVCICLFNSCLRDFELKIPKEEKKVAITCFFSPDSNWNIKIYFTHNIDTAWEDAAINNAQITIEHESGNSFKLSHNSSGLYSSDEKPTQSGTYFLKAFVEGYDTVYAQSYIPERSSISEFTFNDNPGPVLHKNYIDDCYDKIKFNITPNFHKEFYSAIRVMGFNANTGLNIYCIDQKILDALQVAEVPANVINKLKVLIETRLYSYNIESRIKQLLTEAESSSYYYVIKAVFDSNAVCGKLTYRSPSLFNLRSCFSNQGIFYQATYEASTLLLNETPHQNAEIYFIDYESTDEEWLEYKDLSSDYYYFLKDYLLQISNRGETNTSPVIIYSNITNGVGIFAGYQQQLFRIK